MNAMLLPSQRTLFDVPDDVGYFNCAAIAPQLNVSRARLHESVEAQSRPWGGGAGRYFAGIEAIRGLAADVLGGSADAYAVTASASYGASTAARAIEPQLNPGDKVLVLEGEFPSNVLPWRRMASERGAVVVTVPAPADADWTRAILARLDGRTKAVAVASCFWTDGARIDLEAIGAACRDLKASLAIDATQSWGAMRLDLALVQPDFVFAAGHK